MPSLATYLAAGGLVVLAMDFAAPPAGVGLPSAAWPAVAPMNSQIVNRSAKSDRLPVGVAVQRLQGRPASRPLVGCEPLFSPLSVAAQLNAPGRCLA